MPKPLDYRNSADDKRRFVSPRWLVLVLFVAITFVVTLAFSGPSFGSVSYRLLVDGGIVLLWLLAAVGFGAALLHLILREDSIHPILWLVTSAGLGLGAMSLGLLGLGLSGLLNGLSGWIIVLAGLALAVYRIVRSDTPANRERMAASFRQPAAIEWLLLLAIPFVVPMVVGAMAPAGLLWTPDEPHGYDVIEYHLQVPREWYEAGRIAPLHHNVFSFFPFNVEMHYLLAMHLRGGPWAGMYLAQLMHGAFVLLTLLAVYGFARSKTNTTISLLATLSAATVPALSQLGAIAYDEGGFLLFGALSIGWAVRATFTEAHRFRHYILAGVMAGFACGTKLTAVPEVLLAVGLMLCAFAAASLFQSNRKIARQIFGGAVLFGFIGLLTFSPWLIRNIVWAQNPVFPEAARLLGRAHFSEMQVERWERAHSAQPQQRSPSARVRAFWEQVITDWRFGYAFFPMVVVAIVVGARRPQVRLLFGLLLLLAIVWLGFTHLQGRFFILAVPIGAMLVAEAFAGENVSSRRAGIVVLGSLLSIQFFFSAIRLNGELYSHLYRRSVPLAMLLGDDDMSWAVPKLVDDIPSNSPIILVGDAEAFWYYQVPMTRLRYRTVFDVDGSGGEDLIDAWAGPVSQRNGGWLLVSPGELRRFVKTYQPIPPLPDAVNARGNEPYLVAPGK